MAKRFTYIEIFLEDDQKLMGEIKDTLFPKLQEVKIARKYVLKKLLEDIRT